MSNTITRHWPKWVRLLAIGFAFGAVGYLVGQFIAVHVAPDGPSLSELGIRWSDALAALVAASLLVAAIFVLVISYNPKKLGDLYKLEGPASADEAAQARAQSLVIAFSGVLLLLPLIFSLTGVPAVAGAVAIVLLLVVHTVMNVKVYRQADELMRRTVIESSAISFFLGQGLLFLWAAAERLGVVPPITAWDIYAVLMALYLLASAIVSGRRGVA